MSEALSELKNKLRNRSSSKRFNQEWIDNSTPIKVGIWSMPGEMFGEIVTVLWKNENGDECWDDENILGANVVEIVKITNSPFEPVQSTPMNLLADIRNKLGPASNLISLVEMYFNDTLLEDKENYVYNEIIIGISKAKESIEYIKDDNILNK